MLTYSIKTYAVFDERRSTVLWEGSSNECLHFFDRQDDETADAVLIFETGTTTNPLLRMSWKPITVETLRHHLLEANREAREINGIRDYPYDALQGSRKS